MLCSQQRSYSSKIFGCVFIMITSAVWYQLFIPNPSNTKKLANPKFPVSDWLLENLLIFNFHCAWCLNICQVLLNYKCYNVQWYKWVFFTPFSNQHPYLQQGYFTLPGWLSRNYEGQIGGWSIHTIEGTVTVAAEVNGWRSWAGCWCDNNLQALVEVYNINSWILCLNLSLKFWFKSGNLHGAFLWKQCTA